jgi:hypothetical protein
MPTALTGKVAGGTQVSGNVILREQFRPHLKEETDCSILVRQMLRASAILFVLATCLAGFDEILTLQWGARERGALSI